MRQTAPDAELEQVERNKLDGLGEAFEKAWQHLVTSHSELAQPPHAERTREIIALRIIEVAGALGQYDRDCLCEDALDHLRRQHPAKSFTVT